LQLVIKIFPLICSEVKASIIAIRDGEKRKMGQGLKFIILTRKRALIGILGQHLFMEKFRAFILIELIPQVAE